MKTIRWGIIGCGDVTEVKSGPGFQKADHSALVAVMRRQGELARDYAERHGVARWYDNAAALINDSEVDAVYIATPPSSHKEYTLMTAAAGKPGRLASRAGRRRRRRSGKSCWPTSRCRSTMSWPWPGWRATTRLCWSLGSFCRLP